MRNFIFIFLAFALCACGNSETSKSSAVEAPAQAAAAQHQDPNIDFPSLSAAIAGTKLEMTDFNDVNFSRGAAILAVWGARNMTWDDLQKVEQGKYGMVMKDPDSQRGKRLCTYGEIIEIQVDNSVPGKVYLGGLNVYTDEGMRIYRFVAVGSTGELVAGSQARFCGVITGKNSYQNSAGGTTHAVHLVGMFELPENKKPSM